MRPVARFLGLAVLASTMLASPGQAQNPPTPPPNDTTPPAPAADPKACASRDRLVPGERGPQAPPGASENLSDKLARNDGIICPPNIDTEINQPTPDAGKMPVIPPPGSPGGDPHVQPK
jgi:hypothetical protein